MQVFNTSELDAHKYDFIVKGVITAGGLGTRLLPLTKVTNKHLLPVYDRPMIFYPLQTLVQAGISEVMVITGGKNPGAFLELLGDGADFGLDSIAYAYQKGAGGIAAALSLAEQFAGGEPIMVMLGDNIIEDNFKAHVKSFRKGARLFFKKVHNPQQYGVPEFRGQRLSKIVEKPKNPKSPYAQIGIYMYDSTVFDLIRKLKPSRRGELEITGLNNAYIKRGLVDYRMVNGYWVDAGTTIPELFNASSFIRSQKSSEKGKSAP